MQLLFTDGRRVPTDVCLKARSRCQAQEVGDTYLFKNQSNFAQRKDLLISFLLPTNWLASGLPFIGRIHDVPADQTWLKFYEWTLKYGPIYKQEIFGTTHVWISDETIANELIAKKGAIYSDRPLIPNLPDNRFSGAYLTLLGRNGKLLLSPPLFSQKKSHYHLAVNQG